MLNTEAIAGDILRHLRANFRAQLVDVFARVGAGTALGSVRPESYFIGDPSRFRVYQAPSCFLAIPRTNRPGEAGAGHAPQRYQEHPALAIWVLEAPGEEELTRLGWRVAEAADACLHDQDVTPGSPEARSTKCFVTGVDYGSTLTRESHQRVFRKGVTLEVLVKHWDLQTPMAPGTPTVAAHDSCPNVMADVSEFEVTQASTPTAIVELTGQAAGNYVLSLYFRVATGPTSVAITCTWTDQAGPQSMTLTDGTRQVGSYPVMPLYLNLAEGATLLVEATAADASRLFVSLTVEQI